MKLNKILALIILALLITAGSARAGLKLLEGEHTVIYDIVNPVGVAFIPEYSNESFEQKILSQDEFSKRIQVTSRMHPLKSRVPFPIQRAAIPASYQQYLAPEREMQSNDPALINLVRELTRNSRFVHEASHAILSWIADNLTFDATLTVPTDAVSAYRTKKAYCQGYSNLAVAMLRAAGIPARIAHGYLPPGYEWGFSQEYWGVKVNDGGPHRYLEIYYPDTGWAFSDAEHSHNFVDPFHIILRIDGMEMPGTYKGGSLEVDKGAFYTIFKDEDTTFLVDEMPQPKQKRLGRRIDDRQYASLVTGRVSDRAGAPVVKGTAVLWRDGKGQQYPFNGGKYAVSVPASGKYRVELKGPGFAKSSHEIQIQEGQVIKLDYLLQPGGTIKGKAVNSGGSPLQEGDVFYRDGNTSYGVSLDPDGTYRIEGLGSGQYEVSVTSANKKVTHTVTVEAGKETVQNFTVPR